MNSADAILETTGQSLGTATFDGKKIEADGALAQIVAARRRAGSSDPAIWEQMVGSSNGYITFRETHVPADNESADQPVEGA